MWSWRPSCADPGADQGDRGTQIPVDVARRGHAQAVPREREPFGHRGEQFAGNRPSEMAFIEPADTRAARRDPPGGRCAMPTRARSGRTNRTG